jgi:hypothetical protein
VRRYYYLGDLPESLTRERRGGKVFDPTSGLALDWVNRYKTSNFGFIVGAAGAQLLQGNKLRTYLLVQNKDAATDLFLSFGTEANAFNGIIVIPRGNYEIIGGEDGGAHIPQESVNAFATANVNIVVVEGTLSPYEMQE